MKLLLLAVLLTLVSPCWADIGSVTEHRGVGCEIHRDKTKLSGDKGSVVKSMDTVVTAGCVSNITFRDDTKVRVTENSRLMIDDFVFDPKQSDAGRLVMKVGMGTVRYASGQVAKNNPQRVNIKTPTATVAVRGTDFTMTVDETGQSLVVLIPSCKDPRDVKQYELEENRCAVGRIDVTTLTGTVTLNQAFQATYVASASMNPTPATLISTIESKISNNLIIIKPLEVQRAIREAGKTKQEREMEEIEAEASRQLSQRVKEAAEEIEQAKILSQSQASGKNSCNSATHICIRWERSDPPDRQSRGRGVAYRNTDTEHYAEVKTIGYGSNTNLLIVHNDVSATELIGDGNSGGNVVVIRQSNGVLKR
jgi:hypothetical protein